MHQESVRNCSRHYSTNLVGLFGPTGCRQTATDAPACTIRSVEPDANAHDARACAQRVRARRVHGHRAFRRRGLFVRRYQERFRLSPGPCPRDSVRRPEAATEVREDFTILTPRHRPVGDRGEPRRRNGEPTRAPLDPERAGVEDSERPKRCKRGQDRRTAALQRIKVRIQEGRSSWFAPPTQRARA
jgi:hypothetical protein